MSSQELHTLAKEDKKHILYFFFKKSLIIDMVVKWLY